MNTEALAREIKRRNPAMTLEEIARICGVTKQAISVHLKKPVAPPRYQPCPETAVEYNSRYEAEVAFCRQTLSRRGHIWEGARPAFEDGSYLDECLARMLKEGVIVPADDPTRGYVLPKR